MPPAPVYVCKKNANDPEPWVTFGSDRQQYERWAPEICGICCLKMIGDTTGATKELTLYQLTMMAVANGTFVISKDGAIQGAFHYPLAELAESCGIPCRVIRRLDSDQILGALRQGKYVILSINIARVNPAMHGGHLVLVYGHNDTDSDFLLHDCSSVMAQDGCGVMVSRRTLEGISNKKGLIAG